jgi:hypothetical protein
MELTDADRLQMTTMALMRHSIITGESASILSLYDKGNENVSATGGYSQVTLKTLGSGTLPSGTTAIAKEANRVSVNGVGYYDVQWIDVLFSNNTIDLTNYDFLRMKYEIATSSAVGANLAIAIISGSTPAYTAIKSMVGTVGNGIISIDVTTYTGLYHVYFGTMINGVASYYITGGITKVWLLKDGNK